MAEVERNGPVRGRLRPPGDALDDGETVAVLATMGHVRVEHLLSGELAAPVDYLQDHDEWVVTLAGGAVLEVGGASVALAPGDWVLLPRGVPHRLVSTEWGTSWLAVRVPSPAG
jgi:cupin 2 domain-containing protein